MTTDFSNIQSALKEAGRSELCSLFSIELKSSLISNVEALYEEHSDDIVIELIWCLVQTVFDNLPLPFVASNLQRLIEEKDALKKQPRLTFLVTEYVGSGLREAFELRSYILITSRFLIDPTEGLFQTKLEWEKLKSNLLESLELEKINSVKKREPQSYLQSLEETRKKIEKSKPPKLLKTTIVNVPDPILHHSKEPELEARTAAAPRKTDSEDFVFGVAGENFEKPLVISQNDNRNLKKYVPLTIFAMVVILVLSFQRQIYLNFQTLKISMFGTTDTQANIVFETKLEGMWEPIIPTIPPFSLNNMGPSLDDINKRLEKLSLKKEQATPLPAVSPTPKVDDGEIESLSSVPDKAEQKTNPAPIPVLPKVPDTNAATVDLGTNSKTSKLPDPLKTSPDGRIFGPPQVKDPTLGRSNQRALDGSFVKSYEVERFDPPLVFETITATNVMAAPSLMSQTVTRLKSATPIHVSATMGLWLELRSNEGKLGYIFAQDAVKK